MQLVVAFFKTFRSHIMSDIVDEILGGHDESPSTSSPVFFTEDGPEGFVSKSEFITALRKLKGKPAIKQLQKGFANLNAGRSLNGYPTKDFLDSQEVIWLRFYFGKIKQNIPIPAIDGLFEFVTAYANGLITSVKTLEELIQDAASEM